MELDHEVVGYFACRPLLGCGIWYDRHCERVVSRYYLLPPSKGQKRLGTLRLDTVEYHQD